MSPDAMRYSHMPYPLSQATTARKRFQPGHSASETPRPRVTTHAALTLPSEAYSHAYACTPSLM
jgi:hypothetical protein